MLPRVYDELPFNFMLFTDFQIPCGNGQLGFGRRKREIPAALPKDPNALYSVELSTMLKVRFDDDFFKLKKGTYVAALYSIACRIFSGAHCSAAI